jgi:hypothetical protein
MTNLSHRLSATLGKTNQEYMYYIVMWTVKFSLALRDYLWQDSVNLIAVINAAKTQSVWRQRAKTPPTVSTQI